MLEYRQKRKIRKLIYSPITMVLLFVILIVFAKATWNVRQKAAESQVYLAQAQSQLDKASTTATELASSVAALKTQEGVETDIRSQFLVAKPGEQVSVIIDNDATSSGSDTSSNASVKASSTEGFWARIVDFFRF